MATTVWKGQLSFGLVSIPVRLFPAARKQRVRMHYVQASPPRHEDLAAGEEDDPQQRPLGSAVRPIRSEIPEPEPLPQVTRMHQQLVAPGADEPAPEREVLKGYEVAREQYVTFSREELRSLRPATSTEMPILRSVRLSEIDPIYFESSYYVLPDRGGEHAYSLLFRALEKTEYVALAQVTMHGREHIVILRSGSNGILAHTMYFADEIRPRQEFPLEDEIPERELKLAGSFLEAIAGPFAPEEFKDSYREQLQEKIAGKAGRREVSAALEGAPVARPPGEDLMEALRKSLELARKPAQTEVKVARRGPAKITEIKNKRQRKKS